MLEQQHGIAAVNFACRHTLSCIIAAQHTFRAKTISLLHSIQLQHFQTNLNSHYSPSADMREYHNSFAGVVELCCRIISITSNSASPQFPVLSQRTIAKQIARLLKHRQHRPSVTATVQGRGICLITLIFVLVLGLVFKCCLLGMETRRKMEHFFYYTPVIFSRSYNVCLN